MDVRTKVLGAWTLDQFIIEESSGQKRDWGTKAHGLLIYSESGHMSVSINKQVVRESENKYEDLFDSILFYAGTYKVDGNVISHRVTEASNPDRIGKDMIRYCEINGDCITLTTPQESFGKAILVWKKV